MYDYCLGGSSSLYPPTVDLRPYFPYLTDSERERPYYMQELRDKTDKLKQRFRNLLFELQKDIEKSTSFKDVVTWLRLNPGEEQLVKGCSDLSEVFAAISKYVSFFNYRLVRSLALKFGSNVIKKKLKIYMMKFQEYAKGRLCECPRDLFGDVESLEKTYVIKVENDIQTLTVEELQKLEYEMNKILGQKLLRLLNVKDGCVELTFRTFQDEKFSVTKEQKQALRNLGVLHISYGDKSTNLEKLTKVIERKQSEGIILAKHSLV